MRRLLHYVAKLAGERQLAFAVNHGSFGAQNRATDFSPRQAGDQPDFALLMRQRVAELDYPEEVVRILGSNCYAVILAFLNHLAGDLAADVADFALQITHTGFARVTADESGDRFIRELDVLRIETRRFHLLLHQELLGNLDLLRLGIAMQSQNLHAVLQRWRNRVQNVRCSDKEN